jgi:hypothetical protein
VGGPVGEGVSRSFEAPGRASVADGTLVVVLPPAGLRGDGMADFFPARPHAASPSDNSGTIKERRISAFATPL